MRRNKLSDIWLKATVVGSLWATVEIIIGSFFHNLRVPMAGTVLAMISVVIMVSFHQLWKEKGLFWRAGVICALMKSISPSAILLGPMTGILSEALLMELFMRVLGGNLAGYMLGGAFALMSTIAHKLVNLLIIYGFDIVNVLVNLYDYAVAQIGYPELKPELALWLLFGIYAALGMIAAIAGMLIGKKRKTADVLPSIEFEDKKTGVDEYFKPGPNQQFSVKLLFFHLFVVVLCLVIVSYWSLLYGSVFIAAYVVFAVIYYKRALRHLKRPFFWVQVIVLTFLAAIFFNGFKSGSIFNTEGLLAGLQMNVRAVLILVGFSSLSVELRNPVIKTVLMKRGLSQLYLSLGLAFSVLPWIIKNAPKPRQILRSPGRSIPVMLNYAELLLTEFRQRISRPQVLIITGAKHQGKTTFTKEVVDMLQEKGKSIGGFLAIGYFEDNRRSAFDLVSPETGEQKPLCSIHFTGGEKAGPFCFDPEGQNFGKEMLTAKKIAGKDIVVVDEIGPLELEGKGWAGALDLLSMAAGTTWILVVRSSLVEAVKEKWNLTDADVFDIKNTQPDEVARRASEQ